MAAKKEQKNSGSIAMSTTGLGRTIVRPRITEKASDSIAKSNAYVFDVDRSASKQEIARAVRAFYKVTPVKVRTVPVRSKTVFVRGKFGQSSKGKKAYVYLKKGDSIEFV